MSSNADLDRQIAAQAPMSDRPLIAGNRVDLLPSGAAALSAMLQAIAGARRSIHMEYYIFEEIEIDGLTLSSSLIAKAAAGVEVAVSYDAFGSAPTPQRWLYQLSQAGVLLVEYQPLNPFRRRFSLDANYRDHRKILVVDGRIGFLGGVNISHVYANPPDAGVQAATDRSYWLDTAVRIEGPAVARIEALFRDTWLKQEGAALRAAEVAETSVPGGGETIRVEGSAPRDRRPLYSRSLRAAIRAARSRIIIATGYFVPTRREWRLLARAARRGVAVDLLLPGVSDVQQAVFAGRALYGRLLRRGVRIHEVRNAVLHAKAASIDGAWAAIGSSNFDRRSVVYNNEVDAIILATDTARAIEDLLRTWMATATPITLRAWEQRSWREWVHERVARLFRKLL